MTAAAVLSALTLSPLDAKLSTDGEPAPAQSLSAFAEDISPVTAAGYTVPDSESSAADNADNIAQGGDNKDNNKHFDNSESGIMGMAEDSSSVPGLPPPSEESSAESGNSPETETADTPSDADTFPEESSRSDGDGNPDVPRDDRTDHISDEQTSSADDSNESTAEKSSVRTETVSRDEQIITNDGNVTDTAGKQTFPDGTTSERLFDTDINDGGHYSAPELIFTITHLDPELTLRQTEVRLNGVTQSFGNRVFLSAENGGVNVIYISVSYTAQDGSVVTGYREYTVTLDSDSSQNTDSKPETAPRLVTDLTDHSRTDPQYSFTAFLDGNADDMRLDVLLNGEQLGGSGGHFSCTLTSGENVISLRGGYSLDGVRTEINESFTVTLQPDGEAPFLDYENVPTETRSRFYTLDLIGRDSDGERIHGGGLNVVLNGSRLVNRWNGEYTSYLLELAAGENTLDIRVTDRDGRFADYSYVITCLAGEDGEVIGRASMSVDCAVLGLGELCLTDIDIVQGESAARAIISALEESGFTVGYSGDPDSGCYLYSISGEGIAEGAAIPDRLRACIEADNAVSFTKPSASDCLHDRDFTSGSGWMVTVNGHFTSYGLSDIHLQDGDEVRLRFTLAIGKDIGDNGSGSLYDVQY